MYCENLENLVLKRHHSNRADELLILGGYIGFKPLERISKEEINTTIIYGCMAKSNLNKEGHKKYLELTKNSNNLEVFYQRKYNHSKIYCWLRNKKVVQIFAGSANFSTEGLCNDYQEVLFDIDNKYFEETYTFVENALSDSQNCKEFILPPKKEKKSSKEKTSLDQIISYSPPKAKLSLRSSLGCFEKSGININKTGKKRINQKGKKVSHVNINDCYVPIRSSLIDKLPDLFPNKGINVNIGSGWGRDKKKSTTNAEFLFDDGEVIEINFQQKGPERKKGQFLYKGFRSSRSNAILGKYLRKRMNIKDGAPFTELDFKNYGRDDIELTLLAEGQYFADFGVKKQ